MQHLCIVVAFSGVDGLLCRQAAVSFVNICTY